MMDKKVLWNPFNCDDLSKEKGCKHDFDMDYCSNADECRIGYADYLIESDNLSKVFLSDYWMFMVEVEQHHPSFEDLQKWAKAKCQAIYKELNNMNGKEQIVCCFITAFLKENFDLLEDPEL